MTDIKKGPILYKGMVRGRRKFLIINIVLTVLYILFMTRAFPFIKGKLHGTYELDFEKFVASSENLVIDEVIEMKKREDRTIPMYALPGTSYFDGSKYRFGLKFDKFEATGIEYTGEYEDSSSGETVEYVRYSIVFGYVGENKFAVLVNGGELPENGSELSGIFIQPVKAIKADISNLVADGGEIVINEYAFDARNVEMGSEDFDFNFMILGFILLAFLYIRLIRYYANPYKHPEYKQLLKYGELEEIVNDIEKQFQADDVYVDGKELIATDWIMTKDIFKNKIVKNHRTRGRYS